MSKSYVKLSLLVGALTLGLSNVVQADLHVNWLIAIDKLDCLKTCSENQFIKYPIPTGIDKNTGKPSFFMCVTRKERRGEWHPGFNTFGKSTCTTAYGDEVYHGEQYYCLCTNNPRPKIFH